MITFLPYFADMSDLIESIGVEPPIIYVQKFEIKDRFRTKAATKMNDFVLDSNIYPTGNLCNNETYQNMVVNSLSFSNRKFLACNRFCNNCK